jgi:hypothetical protein
MIEENIAWNEFRVKLPWQKELLLPVIKGIPAR